jgi:hypothetical protein
MGALSIPTFEIDTTAACMYIGRDASDAHGRACSGSSAWRPASGEAPVAVWIRSRIQKIAGSRCGCGSGVGYSTRKWRGAGGRCDRFWTIEKRRRECASSRAYSERVSEGGSVTTQAVF